MSKILDYVFGLGRKRTGLDAVGLYFIHVFICFALIIIAFTITGFIIPDNELMMSGDEVRLVYKTVAMVISVAYVLMFTYPVARNFPMKYMVFAIFFSILITLFSGFYMALLFPVFMLTMLPE